MTARAKPYFLKEPWNAQKIEQLDEMLRILYDDLRNGNLNIDLDQIVTGLDEGDILYINGSGFLDGLAIGAANTVLRSDGSLPLWGQVNLTTDVTGILPIANGGTGASTTLGAFNNLSPLTTLGDLLTHNGTNNIRLGIGTAGQVLTVVAGIPAWAAVAAGSGDVVGPGSATDNAIARFDGITGKLIQNSGITIADAAVGTLSGSNSGDVTLAGLDYLTITDQVITAGPIDLATDVIGELPPSEGGFFTHNLLSVSHPDTFPASPIFGDLIVAGEPVSSSAFLFPLATRVVEDFYGLRPSYFGGIPGGTAAPDAGPIPQLYASFLEFEEYVNVPYPSPQFRALTTHWQDDFTGIRPAYIHPPLGGGSIPGSGPFPTIGNYPIEQSAPAESDDLISSGQWRRFARGTEGQLLGMFDGFPKYLTDVNLPGRLGTRRLDVTQDAILHGLLDVGGESFFNGRITGNDIVANLDLAASNNVSAGDTIFSANGYFEYGRADKLGDPVDVAFNAANFTGYDIALSLVPGSWTVGVADQTTFRYVLVGNTVFVTVTLGSTTVASAPVFLAIEVPGITIASSVGVINNSFFAGASEIIRNATNTGLNRILLSRLAFAAWPNLTDDLSVNIQLFFNI